MSILLRATLDGENQLFNLFTYVVLVFWLSATSFWLTRMNQGLALFDGLFIIPVLQVFWTFFSIVSGGIYFQEFHSFAPGQMVGFSCGVLVVFFGVYLLAPGSQQQQPKGSDQAAKSYADMDGTDPVVKNGGDKSDSESNDGVSPLRARGFSYDDHAKKKTRMLSVWTPTTDETFVEMVDNNDTRILEETGKFIGQKIKRKSSAFGLTGGLAATPEKERAGEEGGKKKDALDLRDVTVQV